MRRIITMLTALCRRLCRPLVVEIDLRGATIDPDEILADLDHGRP
jgi:hypothetical protein